MNDAFEQITSFQNAKVKHVKKLRDKRTREQTRQFVVDDGRDLARALDCGYVTDYAFYCPALGDVLDLLDRIPHSAIYKVSKDIMEKAAYRQNPSPILAVMAQQSAPDIGELTRQKPQHILALVDLRKPGNIGALLRTADAAGLRAIFLIDSNLDIYNPNIIRSSTGASFLGNIYMLRSNEALTILREQGYRIIAAAVDGAQSLYDVDFHQQAAIVLGTEDMGLSEMWLTAADDRVQIPMTGRLSDSLNVSVSGAIFMYEALRQRESSRY